MFRFLFAGLPGLLLAGCAATQPLGLSDLGSQSPAADPSMPSSSVRYAPIVGAYTSRTPVTPENWRRTGVEIAPLAPEGGE